MTVDTNKNENLSKENRYPGRHTNRGPPEHNAGTYANQSTAMFDEFDAGVLAATQCHLLRPSVFTVLLEDDFHIPWECTSF